MRKIKGFTLIEVMVVVVILAILASIIVPKLMSRPEQAKNTKAQQDILAIENGLELYKLDNGSYPTSDQGLNALVEKPTTPPIPEHWQDGGYLKRLSDDPWGHPYQYLNPGNHGDTDIYSYGPQGQGDSKNYIGNWQMQK
jgi:general secretion pathway protein G